MSHAPAKPLSREILSAGATPALPAGVSAGSTLRSECGDDAVYRSWRSLLQRLMRQGWVADVPEEFTEELYRHLTVFCGYPAHIGRSSFWDAELGSEVQVRKFLRGLRHQLTGRYTDRPGSDLNARMVCLAQACLSRVEAMLWQSIRGGRLAVMDAIARAEGLEVTLSHSDRIGGIAQRCDVRHPTAPKRRVARLISPRQQRLF